MDEGSCWFIIIFVIIGFAFMIYGANLKSKQIEENKGALVDHLFSDRKFKFDKTFDIISIGINKKIVFDFNKSEMAIIDATLNTTRTIEMNKIISCDIIEDNTTIMEGGLGRAVVGGVLAGGAGAIVGASTRGTQDVVNNLSIRIITNDVREAMVMLPLIETKTKRDTIIYKNCKVAAHEIFSILTSFMKSHNLEGNEIVHQNRLTEKLPLVLNSPDSMNSLTYIRELGKLRDEGLITEEEFQKKKTELLLLPGSEISEGGNSIYFKGNDQATNPNDYSDLPEL